MAQHITINLGNKDSCILTTTSLTWNLKIEKFSHEYCKGLEFKYYLGDEQIYTIPIDASCELSFVGSVDGNRIYSNTFDDIMQYLMYRSVDISEIHSGSTGIQYKSGIWKHFHLIENGNVVNFTIKINENTKKKFLQEITRCLNAEKDMFMNQ